MTAAGGSKNPSYSGLSRQRSAQRRNETWLYSNPPTPTRRPARKGKSDVLVDRIYVRRQARSRVGEDNEEDGRGGVEKRRRLDLERTYAGMPAERRENRIRSVADVVKPYLKRYEQDHRGREKSILFAKSRLAHVTRLLGKTLLSDLTEDVVRGYITTRIGEGMSGRTCNMEVGELSRAIGKPWSILWPKVRKQEERKDIGRALSPEEESRLSNRREKRSDGTRRPLSFAPCYSRPCGAERLPSSHGDRQISTSVPSRLAARKPHPAPGA